MKRRELISLMIGTSACYHATAKAENSAQEPSDTVPRWKFLGDDDALRETIKESGQVLLICIFETLLERVKPPFAEVVLRATVVQAIKGAHTLGDRITIRFSTDSLPTEEVARNKFIQDVDAKNLGSLRMAFLRGDRSDNYQAEWLDIAAFDPEMLTFAIKNIR